MSITPVVYLLHTVKPNGQVIQEVHSSKDDEFIQRLSKFSESFCRDLRKAERLETSDGEQYELKFRITEKLQKSRYSLDKNSFDFVEVQFHSSKDEQNYGYDRVNISVLEDNNVLTFIVSPGGYLAVYKINEFSTDARLRNKVLELIIDALYKTTNCTIAVTCSSERQTTPESIHQAVSQWLPNSTFSIFKSSLLPDLNAEGLTQAGVYIKQGDHDTTIATTDHPFSLSRYNSSGVETWSAYQRYIAQALPKLTA